LISDQCPTERSPFQNFSTRGTVARVFSGVETLATTAPPL
jgi:hypothetical protein